MRLWSLRSETDLVFKEARLRTNRWGMRDMDYDREKPDSTFRFGLLGASYVMGSGVEDDETFENVVERRLNAGSDSTRYEILNFAVGGYGLAQQIAVAEEDVFAFDPDALLYVLQPGELRRLVVRLYPVISAGKEVTIPYYRDVLAELGVDAGTKRAEALRALYTRADDMMDWGYARIAELARANGALPILVYLPSTGLPFDRDELDQLNALAERHGFEVIDLGNVYAGRKAADIQLAAWDAHPNAEGHRLIADALYEALRQHSANHVAMASAMVE